MRRILYVLLAALLAALTFAPLALAQSGPSSGHPSLTDDLGSWAAIVGILLPALVALLQKDRFGDTVNGLIFAAAVVVASVVYGWIKFGDNFSWQHWQGTVLAILTWGIATYKLYWKPSQIAAKLRALPDGRP